MKKIAVQTRVVPELAKLLEERARRARHSIALELNIILEETFGFVPSEPEREQKAS